MSDQINTLMPMNEAPKDGTKIIIMWVSPADDLSFHNIRIAWWWSRENDQYGRGARAHWLYISDDNFTRSIKKPIGWMPIPTVPK